MDATILLLRALSLGRRTWRVRLTSSEAAELGFTLPTLTAKLTIIPLLLMLSWAAAFPDHPM